jgi:hypothetical protein
MQPAYLSSYDYSAPKAPKPEGKPGVPWPKWLVYVLAGFSGVVLLMLILGWLFSPEISRKALEAVSKEIKTKTSVGSVDLSLFRSFPRASVVLKQVYLEDVNGKPLLAANEVNLDFNLLSIFGTKTVIDRITIRKGVLHLITDLNGVQNWHVLKGNATKQQAEPVILDIRDARLIDIDLRVSDLREPWSLHTNLNDARFYGRFAEERFALTSQATSTVQSLTYHGDSWLSKSTFDWKTTMLVDLDKNAWQFREGQCIIGKQNTISLQGMAVFAAKHTDLDLRFKAEKGDVSLLLHLLPDAWKPSLAGLSSTGSYHCSGTAKGRLSNQSKPSVSLKFGMHDGKLTHTALPKPFTQVRFEAELKYLPNGDGYIRVPEFRAQCDGAPLAAHIYLKDFRNPWLDLAISGRIRVQQSSANQADWAVNQGIFDVKKLEIQGALAHLKNPSNYHQVHMGGEASARDLIVQYRNKEIRVPHSHVRVVDGSATIDQTALHLKQTVFTLEGQVQGLIPYVFGSSQAPILEMRLVSEHLILDEVLEIFSGKQTNTTAMKTGSTQSDLALPLSGKLHLNIKSLRYQEVQANQLTGMVYLNPKRVQFKASALAMQGRVAVAGSAQLANQTRLDLNVGMQSVNLPTLFAQTKDFGQETITQHNISGTMTGRIAATAYFDASGNHLTEQLVVYSDILAHKGSLKGIKTFDDFSDYIHIDDLHNVRFNTLQNYIEVRNQTVYLPAMDIRNNACNMTISGEQSFDDKISWYIKVNAGQALMNRLRKTEADGEILTGSNGWINLYYTMLGTLDKYKIERNKTVVRREFESSQHRKEQIAAAIERAFDTYPPDFEMVAPLREISDAEPIVQVPVSDAKPEPSTQKPDAVEKPRKQRPLTRTRTELPHASVISQSSDDEFLDEIVGGGENH